QQFALFDFHFDCFGAFAFFSKATRWNRREFGGRDFPGVYLYFLQPNFSYVFHTRICFAIRGSLDAECDFWRAYSLSVHSTCKILILSKLNPMYYFINT